MFNFNPEIWPILISSKFSFNIFTNQFGRFYNRSKYVVGKLFLAIFAFITYLKKAQKNL